MGKHIEITIDLIDKADFESALETGMSDIGIQDLFELNLKQIYKWVKMAYKTKNPLVQIKKIRAQGELKFRQSQLALAKKDRAVSIWIDKTWYGRNDIVETVDESSTIEDLNPLLQLLKDDPKQPSEPKEEGKQDGTNRSND